jgi:hypothetical protein
MNHYETSATIGGQGDLHLAGLPFTPGTEVEIVVSPKPAAADPQQPSVSSEQTPSRVRELFAALDKARNTEPVGPLHREELYDRKVLR